MVSFEGDRRGFLRDTVGRLARHVAAQAEQRMVQQRYLRPPGALPELAFVAACTRCGACVDVCPVRAIVNAPVNAGLAARTPMIDISTQACIACPEMPCAAACPTGALIRPETRWEGVHLGVIELDPNRCIAFHGTNCGVCARQCPVGETALSLDEEGRPVLKAEGCVGCGVCVRACVTSPASLALTVVER